MGKTIIMSAMCAAAVSATFIAGAQTQTQTQTQPPPTRLTIEDCYERARANYPLIEQAELIERTAEYNLSNAARGWLPQVAFSAQASYQSDVTRLPFDAAQLGFAGLSIPTPGRDQYGAKVEVSQTVWDGGAVGARREGVKAAAEAERTTLETNLYALRERVNGLFFGILLAEGRLEQMALLEENLAQNRERVEAALRGGMAMQSDVDAIRVEILKAGQQKAALRATRRACRDMLSRLVGVELGAETELVKPPLTSPAFRVAKSAAAVATAVGVPTVPARPELAMFEARARSIEARGRQLNAAITPRLGLFATGGYGKPGLDMLSDRFDSYYVVGARLSWNIGGLYTRRNDRRQIAADVRGVELRRDAFLLNADIDARQRSTDIDRLAEQLALDDEIIELRGAVRRSSEAKMANGTISGSDLARDLNAEQAARQERVVHEMELLLAIYNLKFVTNN